MNARTSRLLRRVAFAMHKTDARRHPETEAQHLAGLIKAWNSTPAAQRYATRVGLVNVFNQIVRG